MINDELEELISLRITQALDGDYNKTVLILKKFKESVTDFYESNKIKSSRLDNIESMIKEHALGVQNVYNEFKEIKELIDKLNKKSMEKAVEEIQSIKEEFNIHYHRMDDMLTDFKNKSDNIDKISKILDMLEEKS